MMPTQTPVQKATARRIQAALSKPGSVGMKGFLLWTEAAWPPAISQKILQAASKYTPGAGIHPGAVVPPMAPLAHGGFGRFGALRLRPFHIRHNGGLPSRVGAFGDITDGQGITVDLTSIPDSVTSAITDASTPPPVSATTNATSSSAASGSWLQDITGAVTAATTAYLGAQQVKDAQSIFNTNLARAQQGLPMIPTNPTQYGLPAPTANIGLTTGAQSAVLWGVGLLAGGLILAGALGGRGKRA